MTAHEQIARHVLEVLRNAAEQQDAWDTINHEIDAATDEAADAVRFREDSSGGQYDAGETFTEWLRRHA